MQRETRIELATNRLSAASKFQALAHCQFTSDHERSSRTSTSTRPECRQLRADGLSCKHLSDPSLGVLTAIAHMKTNSAEQMYSHPRGTPEISTRARSRFLRNRTGGFSEQKGRNKRRMPRSSNRSS